MWGLVRKLIDLDAVPAAACSLWEAEPESFRCVSGGANVIFRFEHDGRGRYLRVNHPRARSRDEIRSVLEFQMHLADCGAPVCSALPSRHGRLLEELVQGEQVFLASVVAEVPGRVLGRDVRELAIFHALGRGMAALHRASESYAPATASSFLDSASLWRLVEDRLGPGDELARGEFEQIDAWWRTLGEDTDFGLTHGDYNMGNVIWDGERVWTIDFDEPLWCCFAADLARPFRDFADRPAEQRRQILAQMAAGYRSLRPLEDRWLDAVPWLMRMKDLEIYTWASTLQEPPDSLPGSGQPIERELRELRARFAKPLAW